MPNAFVSYVNVPRHIYDGWRENHPFISNMNTEASGLPVTQPSLHSVSV